MGIKKIIAILTAIVLAIPNGILAAICFYALIGNLSYIFGIELNHSATLVIAVMIGAGLTLGEALTHMDAKDKGFNFTKFIALLLFAIINVFAGNYRVAESGRLARMNARQQAENDPRWLALDKAQESYDAMNNNGYRPDDADASAGLERIARERHALTQEYVDDASVNTGNVGILGLGSSWFLNLLWIGINITFGIAIQAAYEGKDERHEAKPFNFGGWYFQRTPLRGATNYTVTPAYGQTEQQPETPKRSPGFHASWREEYAETAAKPMPIKTGRIDLPHTPEPEIVERIVYIEVPVEKETKTTEVITKKETPDMRDKARRSAAKRSAESERLAAKARRLKAQNPKMTVNEIAEKIGRSPASIRNYLK